MDELTHKDCLNNGGKTPCSGKVEYRMPLSGTGKSFPRCDKHWDDRLDKQEEFHQRDREYRNIDYMAAGERYDED